MLFSVSMVLGSLPLAGLQGHPAPQVSLSCMHRVAKVKFNEGLQHNTCRTYHSKQQTFWTFCAQHQLAVFPASEDTLMVFVTYLGDQLQRHYATIHHYMVTICMAHIALELPSSLEIHPCLHQLLRAIHHQQPQSKPQPDSSQHAITMEILCWASPLHWLHNAKDSVLWAALTIGHYGLFHSGELAQPKLAEAGVAWFIRVQDITPHFMQGCLHFVHIKLSVSKTNPFQLGCPVIIGCTGTTVCGACEAWHTVQFHRCTWTPLDAPFLQVDGRALGRLTLVNHIKTMMAKLGLHSSRYSGHSLCIWGATSAMQAGLSQWQIKLLG